MWANLFNHFHLYDDVSREAEVIQKAVKDNESMGLESNQVEEFFKAQIEANKLTQFSAALIEVYDAGYLQDRRSILWNPSVTEGAGRTHVFCIPVGRLDD